MRERSLTCSSAVGMAAILVFAVLLGFAVTLPASASGPQTAAATYPWLAAGDSYSSGEGLPHSTGPCVRPKYGSRSKNWAQAAYADLQRAHSSLLSRPIIRACTGAKIGEFFASQGKRSAQWNPGMGRFEYITFTFGGNDVDFADVVAQCIHAPFSKKFPSDPGHHCPAEGLLRAKINALGAQYQSFLTQVAQRAVFTGGSILVLGYPELIEAPSLWSRRKQHAGGCGHFTTADAYEIRGLAGYLNATIGNAVTAIDQQRPNSVHVGFLDVNSGGTAGISNADAHLFEPTSGTRHNLCSAHPWINPIKINLGSRFHDLKEGSYHPNQAGQSAMGALAAEFILHPPIAVSCGQVRYDYQVGGTSYYAQFAGLDYQGGISASGVSCAQVQQFVAGYAQAGFSQASSRNDFRPPTTFQGFSCSRIRDGNDSGRNYCSQGPAYIYFSDSDGNFA